MLVKDIGLLTYDAFLSAAEYLEGIAVIMVYGGAAPYLGILTIAGTEYRHGNGKHVVTLVFESNSRLCIAGIISCRITKVSEYLVLLHHILIDVDDDITVDMTAVVATTVDITIQQTQVLTHCTFTDSQFFKVFLVRIPICSIPLKVIAIRCQLVIGMRRSIGNLRTVGNEFA